jgi:hypothetical protein
VNASLTRYFSQDVMSFTINSEASGEKGTQKATARPGGSGGWTNVQSGAEQEKRRTPM